jgi:hypothetical protein
MHHITRRLSPSIIVAIVALAAAWACAGTASAAVPGLHLVTTGSDLNSVDKGRVAVCPSGESAVGGGGQIIFGNGQVLLDDMVPKTGAFSAFGREDQDGFQFGWGVAASAICASPIPGLQVVPGPSPVNSDDKSARATCPPDKQVIGAGAELNGGSGQVTLDDVIPKTTTVDVRAREDRDGLATNWSVTAYAVCANPLPGLQIVQKTSATDSFASKSIAANCPPGKKLLGGGGEITFGSGGTEVVLTEVRPNGSTLTSMIAGASEIQGGSTRNWNITAYAVCAFP